LVGNEALEVKVLRVYAGIKSKAEPEAANVNVPIDFDFSVD
jgi:hypothetical protein